jgi:hypothetical protein
LDKSHRKFAAHQPANDWLRRDRLGAAVRHVSGGWPTCSERSARRRCSSPASPSRRADRSGAQKACFTRPGAFGLRVDGTGQCGVSSRVGSRRSKAPRPPLRPSPFARRVEVGLGFRFAEQVDQTLSRRAGKRHGVFGRSITSRPLRDFRARWLGDLPAGAVLPSGVRSVSSGNRAARRFGHKLSEPTECAETAGSVRGRVVHAVCPCSLKLQKSVGGVGSVWPLSVAAGSGTGRASSKRLRATGERASEAGDVRFKARVAGRGPDRAPHRRKASRIGNPPFFNASGGANDLGRRVRLGVQSHGSVQAATGRQNPGPVRPVESITLGRAGGIIWQ